MSLGSMQASTLQHTPRISGSVKTLDWRKAEEREQACRLLCMHAAQDPHGPSTPLLIKHAVDHWPACQKWTLPTLQAILPSHRVQVRCASSLDFYYVESKLVPLWQRLRFVHKQQYLPSVLRTMLFSEFARRIQPGSKYKNVYFPDDQQELYYMQSCLPPELYSDIDLYNPPISCLGQPGMTGENGTVAMMPSGMQVSQYPRLFISPAGAVSPLHYDTSSSFLVQIKGKKRMLFYAPKDLSRLYTYKNWHILRRRSRVDPLQPDLAKYPKFGTVTSMEAVLEPSDVLWFPGYWSHHTTSLELSMSMTYRFWTEVQRDQQKRKAMFGLLSLL